MKHLLNLTAPNPLNSASPDSPFVVPPFDLGKHRVKPYYYWWSWHPFYPYWSKSCWGDADLEVAKRMLDVSSQFSLRSDMLSYHNKLIFESDQGYVEVFDKPCEEMERWCQIKAEMINKTSKQTQY